MSDKSEVNRLIWRYYAKEKEWSTESVNGFRYLIKKVGSYYTLSEPSGVLIEFGSFRLLKNAKLVAQLIEFG